MPAQPVHTVRSLLGKLASEGSRSYHEDVGWGWGGSYAHTGTLLRDLARVRAHTGAHSAHPTWGSWSLRLRGEHGAKL